MRNAVIVLFFEKLKKCRYKKNKHIVLLSFENLKTLY